MKVPERIKKSIKLAMYHARLSNKYEIEIYDWLEKNNFIDENNGEGINGFNLDALIDDIHFNGSGQDYEKAIEEFENMVKEGSER